MAEFRDMLMQRMRHEFDRIAAEKLAEIRERFAAVGVSPDEVDALIEANEPNMRAAWAQTARTVEIEAMKAEALDG